jgi:hypothetical protein
LIKLIKIIKEDPDNKCGTRSDGEEPSRAEESAPSGNDDHDYDKLDDFIKLKKDKRAISFDDLKAVKSSLYEIGKLDKDKK